MKIDLQYFDGHLHMEDFLDWVHQVENLFNIMEVPLEKRVKLVAYKLKGEAAAWWEQVQSSHHSQGKHPIQT